MTAVITPVDAFIDTLPPTAVDHVPPDAEAVAVAVPGMQSGGTGFITGAGFIDAIAVAKHPDDNEYVTIAVPAVPPTLITPVEGAIVTRPDAVDQVPPAGVAEAVIVLPTHTVGIGVIDAPCSTFTVAIAKHPVGKV